MIASVPKRLLLVGDEPRDLAVLEGLLSPLGYELFRSTGGPVAMARVGECRPHLVLIDLVIPGSGGLDVLKDIRGREGDDHVPVILLSAPGDGERDRRVRGLEAGADESLDKPLDGPVLRARVSTLLQLKDSRDAIRRSNEDLASRNRTLERLQREQRELIAFIVHDLKNPLSVVWSSVEFARSEAKRPTSVLTAALEEASQASRRLRVMIDDLLIISRLEDSEFPLHPEPIPLSELLKDVMRTYVRRAEEKKVDLVAFQSAQVRVSTDRTLLQRVIENILDNSLRYTPAHGRVSVATRLGNDVEIAVSNTGPSIPPSDRLRIFEKFARLEKPGVARGNAGLGLYFCKRAIEALGGNIEVTETPEWPTSFILRLPQH